VIVEVGGYPEDGGAVVDRPRARGGGRSRSRGRGGGRGVGGREDAGGQRLGSVFAAAAGRD
jgi:hypothetical protein